MIEHQLFITLSQTTFIDAHGNVRLAPGGLSQHECTVMRVYPLIVMGIVRKDTGHWLYQFTASTSINIGQFFIDAWSKDRLGGVPDALVVHHGGSMDSVMTTIREYTAKIAPKLIVTSKAIPATDQTLEQVSRHTIHLIEKHITPDLSGQEIIESGNRREALDCVIELIKVQAAEKVETGKPLKQPTGDGAAVISLGRWLPVASSFTAERPVREGMYGRNDQENFTVLFPGVVQQQNPESDLESFIRGVIAGIEDAADDDTEIYADPYSTAVSILALPKNYLDSYEVGVEMLAEAEEYVFQGGGLEEYQLTDFNRILSHNNIYLPDSADTMEQLLMATLKGDTDAIFELEGEGPSKGEPRTRYLLACNSDEDSSALYCCPTKYWIVEHIMANDGRFQGTIYLSSKAFSALKALLKMPLTAGACQHIMGLINEWLADDDLWPIPPMIADEF